MTVSIIILFTRPEIYNFEYYRLSDLFFFSLSSIAHYISQNLASLAYKYEEASKVTPIAYTIGVFLALVDILIFGYEFNITDITGMVIVMVSLAIPVTIKLCNSYSQA